jgi:hypothetical protein
MKNNYRNWVRQIEKSVRNDYNQNIDLDMFIKKKVTKKQMVMLHGKLQFKYPKFSNDIPQIWVDGDINL